MIEILKRLKLNDKEALFQRKILGQTKIEFPGDESNIKNSKVFVLLSLPIFSHLNNFASTISYHYNNDFIMFQSHLKISLIILSKKNAYCL